MADTATGDEIEPGTGVGGIGVTTGTRIAGAGSASAGAGVGSGGSSGGAPGGEAIPSSVPDLGCARTPEREGVVTGGIGRPGDERGNTCEQLKAAMDFAVDGDGFKEKIAEAMSTAECQ